jgi:hypothetical protein
MKKRENFQHQLFGLIILLAVGWIWANYLSDHVQEDKLVLLWTRLTFLFPSLFVWVLLLFCSAFPNNQPSITPYWHIFVLLPNLFSTILIFTDKILSKIQQTPSGVNIEFGSLSWFYLLYFVCYLSASLILLVKKRRDTRGFLRLQISYLLYGLGSFLIFATITNLFVPFVFGIFGPTKYGPYFTLLFLGFTYYAMMKYRLMDIRILISRSITYASLFALLVGLIGSAIYLIDDYDDVISPIFLVFLMSTSTFIIALVFHPAKQFFDRLFIHIFAPDAPLYKGAKQINEVISDVNELTTYVQKIQQFVREQVNVKSAYLFLINKLDGNYEYHIESGERLILNLNDPLVRLLLLDRLPLVKEEIPKLLEDPNIARKELLNESEKSFHRIDQAGAFPIFDDEHEMIALLTVGPKSSGESFTREDIQWLLFTSRDLSQHIWKYMTEEEIRFRCRKYIEALKEHNS